MEIRIDITPLQAEQINSDLKNTNIKFLPETEKVLYGLLDKLKLSCSRLEDELSEFLEIGIV